MRSVIIVGGGFCGVTTAIQIMLKATSSLEVVLINRTPDFGRGLAYSTFNEDHLLNVPAGNMSALEENPDHFLEYCQTFDKNAKSSDFFPRRLYGDYLESLLRKAELANANVSLIQIVGNVSSIEQSDKNPDISVTVDGICFKAEKVILATGNLIPQNLKIKTPAFYLSNKYIADPWRSSAIEKTDRSLPILLIGSGLTAIDICASLSFRTGNGIIYLVSRHGLLPQSHRTNRVVENVDHFADLGLEPFSTLRSQVKTIIAYCSALIRRGKDWRELFGALRPHTQSLWAQLSWSDKQRFLRHLRTYWDVHRHRLAPIAFQRFQKSIEAGEAKVVAGQIIDLQEHDAGVKVSIHARHQENIFDIDVGAVINCTGPSSQLKNSGDELMQALLKAGIVRADTLGLGIDVTQDCRVINQKGIGSKNIFYVGPLLRSLYWEATAVPELRVFARQVADTVLED